MGAEGPQAKTSPARSCWLGGPQQQEPCPGLGRLSGAWLLWLCCSRCPLCSPAAEADPWERACDTLLMCIVTVLNHGLRNGGGVGDILRKPSKDVSVGSPWSPSCCPALEPLLLPSPAARAAPPLPSLPPARQLCRCQPCAPLLALSSGTPSPAGWGGTGMCSTHSDPFHPKWAPHEVQQGQV